MAKPDCYSSLIELHRRSGKAFRANLRSQRGSDLDQSDRAKPGLGNVRERRWRNREGAATASAVRCLTGLLNPLSQAPGLICAACQVAVQAALAAKLQTSKSVADKSETPATYRAACASPNGIVTNILGHSRPSSPEDYLQWCCEQLIHG